MKFTLDEIFNQVNSFNGHSGELHLDEVTLKLNATKNNTIRNILKLHNKYNVKLECVCCKTKPTHFEYINYHPASPEFIMIMNNGFRMTLDHITPKSKGGNNSLKNMQLMCKDCNNMKGNLEIKNNWLLYQVIKIKKAYFKFKRDIDFKNNKRKLKAEINRVLAQSLVLSAVII